MITVETRDTTRIITLNIPGKAPIHSKNGNDFFHSSFDLLCCSVGSCVGQTLKNICSIKNYNIKLIEKVIVNMNNFNINVHIFEPSDIPEDIHNAIANTLATCDIIKVLSCPVNFIYETSTKNTEELLNTIHPKCCGEQ